MDSKKMDKATIKAIIIRIGWQRFLESLQEIIEDEAVHFTDSGDDEGREQWDITAENIGLLLSGDLPR